MQMQTGTEMLILSCSLQRMDETVKGAMLMPELVKRIQMTLLSGKAGVRAGEREETKEIASVLRRPE